jgi:hypothetical protein
MREGKSGEEDDNDGGKFGIKKGKARVATLTMAMARSLA